MSKSIVVCRFADVRKTEAVTRIAVVVAMLFLHVVAFEFR